MMRKEHGRAVAPAIGIVLWAAAAVSAPAQAAGIGWDKPGAFQTCLDGKAKTWIDAKVEQVVNEDPEVGAVDDSTVAQWATQALKECGAKATGADPASEAQFMKYMAHWREHIDRAANEIRRRSRPD